MPGFLRNDKYCFYFDATFCAESASWLERAIFVIAMLNGSTDCCVNLAQDILQED